MHYVFVVEVFFSQRESNFAARIVTGLSRRDHISAALEALEWPKFDKMLEDRDMAMLG